MKNGISGLLTALLVLATAGMQAADEPPCEEFKKQVSVDGGLTWLDADDEATAGIFDPSIGLQYRFVITNCEQYKFCDQFEITDPTLFGDGAGPIPWLDPDASNGSARLAPGEQGIIDANETGFEALNRDPGECIAMNEAAETNTTVVADPVRSDPVFDSAFVTCPSEEASIGDFVWEDQNGDGLQDDGEPGIDGVTIELFACNAAGGDPVGGPIATYVTMPGDNGAYAFTGLDAGAYKVAFTLPDGFVVTDANAGDDTLDSDAVGSGDMGMTACFDLAEGEMNDTIDAGGVQPARLGDFVWNDLDADGVQGGSEPGIQGCMVSLQDAFGDPVTDASGAAVGSTSTDANGEYGFDNLLPGTYMVMFDSACLPGSVFTEQLNPGMPVASGTDSDADANGKSGMIVLASGADVPDVDAGLTVPATAQLGNFVFEDNDADGVQDGDDVGVDDIKVTLFSYGLDDPNCDSADPAMQMTTTSGGGAYSFTDLPAGNYVVEFGPLPDGFMFSPNSQTDEASDSDAGDGSSASRTACTNLIDGEVNETLDAGIFRKAMLGDFVWFDLDRDGIQDPDEPGIDNAKVELFACGADPEVDAPLQIQMTMNGGLYKFNELMPGEYFVRFMDDPNADPMRVFSPADAGDDGVDSDADASGITACVRLDSGDFDDSVDAGLNVPPAPAIDIEKATNDEDADTPTGPVIAVGGQVTWTYVVTNTGNVDLLNVAVTDSVLGDICTIGELPMGESETCTAEGLAEVGQYSNVGKATGDPATGGEPVMDTDPSHYLGEAPACSIVELDKRCYIIPDDGSSDDGSSDDCDDGSSDDGSSDGSSDGKSGSSDDDSDSKSKSDKCDDGSSDDGSSKDDKSSDDKSSDDKSSDDKSSDDGSSDDDSSADGPVTIPPFAEFSQACEVVLPACDDDGSSDDGSSKDDKSSDDKSSDDKSSDDKSSDDKSSDDKSSDDKSSDDKSSDDKSSDDKSSDDKSSDDGSSDDKSSDPQACSDSVRVIYGYRVSNAGPVDVTGILVNDDKLGDIGTPFDLAAGDDAVLFSEPVSLSSTTTNTATALGTGACDVAEDEVIVTVTEPPVDPGSCDDGKPKTLVFEYTGESCAASNNDQSSSKSSCLDSSGPLGANPVFTYTGKNGDEIGFSVNGNMVTLDAFGKDSLDSNSDFEITSDGGSQAQRIHTSCSAPLNVGDQFGSLILREFVPRVK